MFSLVHESDLCLRRLIKEKLSDSSLNKSEKLLMSRELAAKKSSILSEIKNDVSGLGGRLFSAYFLQNSEEKNLVLERELKCKLSAKC